MRLVAVTSCPTGIAHTYMAAEALELAAKDAGHDITVETQGAAGSTPLAPEVIAAADAVIFAADVEVRDRHRFAGKPTVEAPVKRAINAASDLIAEAAAARLAVPPADGASVRSAPMLATKVEAGAGFATRLRQWLMTGVSYMIPFVAAGGILIALSFIISGPQVAMKVFGGTFHGHTYKGVVTGIEGFDVSHVISAAGYGGLLFMIGKVAFFMLVPILAGFIAFAMADRMGLVPGIVAGLIATATGAGFLGGIIGGLLAGAVVMGLRRIEVPRALAGVMPVVVIPLISTIVVGLAMTVVVGRPVSWATTQMTNGLNGLSGSNAVLLGALLGLMMAFDMGGPVNKVAYTFGVAALSTGNLKIMAAVMAAGMTPPLALALATVVRPKLFSDGERKAGEAAWLLGASFITEGAIPFAAADPIRVIPSIMAGSALTGGLSMAFGATSRAPHGGIWIIGLIGKPGLYLLAIAAGTALSAAAVVVAKSCGRRPVATGETPSSRVESATSSTDAVPVGA